MSIIGRGRGRDDLSLGAKLVMYVIVVLLGISMIVPFLWMLSTSLKTDQQVWAWPPRWIPNPVRLQNYSDAWGIAPFGRFFINSIFISVSVTIASLFFNSLAGFSFAHYDYPGKDFIFLTLLATMMIPGYVTIIPSFILMKILGWLDTYQGLIVPGFAGAFGIFLMRQFLMTIPRDLIEAARIDGCSEFRIYWQIVLPLSKPAMSALGIFTFMGAWNNFLWPLVMVKSEEMKTLPLAVASLAQGHYVMSWPILMAGACIIIIPVILVFLLFQRQFIQGIAMTGLKS